MKFKPNKVVDRCLVKYVKSLKVQKVIHQEANPLMFNILCLSFDILNFFSTHSHLLEQTKANIFSHIKMVALLEK